MSCIPRAHEMIDGVDCARCSTCGQFKPFVDEFRSNRSTKDGRHGLCRECEAVISRRSQLAKYGLTEAEYDAMFALQGGVCAVCAQECVTGQSLCVDHDHSTGEVRSLLCRRCNAALGLADEDPDRLRAMAKYVESYSIIPRRIRS